MSKTYSKSFELLLVQRRKLFLCRETIAWGRRCVVERDALSAAVYIKNNKIIFLG